MEKATVKSKLVAYQKDIMDYTTYVFELIDEEDKIRLQTKYCMCVKYPNWQTPPIKLYQIGYLEVMEVIAGIDKYFNGSTMIPYNYSNVQFLRFVPFKEEINKEIKLD